MVLTSDDTDVRVDMKDPQVMASTKYNHHRTLEEDVNHLKECQHQGLLASKGRFTSKSFIQIPTHHGCTREAIKNSSPPQTALIKTLLTLPLIITEDERKK